MSRIDRSDSFSRGDQSARAREQSRAQTGKPSGPPAAGGEAAPAEKKPARPSAPRDVIERTPDLTRFTGGPSSAPAPRSTGTAFGRALAAPAPATGRAAEAPKAQGASEDRRLLAAALAPVRAVVTAAPVRRAAPLVPRLSWERVAPAMVASSVREVDSALAGVKSALEQARTALATTAGEGFAVGWRMRAADQEARSILEDVAAAALRIRKEVAPAKADGIGMGIAAVRERVGALADGATELGQKLQELAGRARTSGAREALGEIGQAVRGAVRAGDGLRLLAGRVGILKDASALAGRPGSPAAPASTFPFGAVDPRDIGSAGRADREDRLMRERMRHFSTRLPFLHATPDISSPQMLWDADTVLRMSATATTTGGMSEAQFARNNELAHLALPGDEWGAARPIDPTELAAVLRESGLDLSQVDPNQVRAAARYVNGATSLADQRARLRQVTDSFHVLVKNGPPALSRQQMADFLQGRCNVPANVLEKMSDQDLAKVYQQAVAAINSGPGRFRIKLSKKWRLYMTIGENGEIESAKAKKKKGFFGSLLGGIGKLFKSLVPIALTVMSFIPATAPFARIAQAAISLYGAIKQGSILGIATAGAALIGAGSALAGGLARGAQAVADKVASVASSVSRVLHGVEAVRRGDLVGGLAGVAAGLADGVEALAGGAADGLGRLADGIRNAAGRAVAGAEALQAARRGDFIGAVGLGANLAADLRLTGAQADAVLRGIGDHARSLGLAEKAIRAGDYLGAARELTGLLPHVAQGPARDGLEKAASVIGEVAGVQGLLRAGDYLGAASALSEAAAGWAGSEATRRRIAEASAYVRGAADGFARARSGDYVGAVKALSRVAAGARWDEGTRERLQAAAEVFQRAQAVQEAVRSGRFFHAASIAASLASSQVGGNATRQQLAQVARSLDEAAELEQAVRHGDYARAAAILDGITTGRASGARENGERLRVAGAAVERMVSLGRAIGGGDYTRAAELAAELEGGEEARRIASAFGSLVRAGEAVRAGDWPRALLAAEELVPLPAEAASAAELLRALRERDADRARRALESLAAALGRRVEELTASGVKRLLSVQAEELLRAVA